MFRIPPEIQAMLQSEDVEKQHQGLAALVGAVGQTVHKNVRQEILSQRESLRNELRTAITRDAEMAQQARSVFNDFYGTYPELNKPELRGLVESVSRAVVAETKAQQWSADLRDKIGGKVRSILGSVVQNPQPPAESSGAPPAAPTQAAPAKKATPPRMRGTGTRPAPDIPPKPGSQEAHMLELIRGIH
jgi:hypothetical protein